MFVVTGTPRSATGYASLLFKAAGLECTHEKVFRPNAPLGDVLEWLGDSRADKGESSWLAWMAPAMSPGPLFVLHSVRDPWAVIDSLASRNDILPVDADAAKDSFRNIIWAYCPEVFGWSSSLDRAAQFVLSWSVLIQERVICHSRANYHRYHCEDVNAEWLDCVCHRLGCERTIEQCRAACEATPRNVNHQPALRFNVPVDGELLDRIHEDAPDMPRFTHIARLSSPAEVGATAEQVQGRLSPPLLEGVSALCEEWGYPRARSICAPVPAPKELEHASQW